MNDAQDSQILSKKSIINFILKLCLLISFLVSFIIGNNARFENQAISIFLVGLSLILFSLGFVLKIFDLRIPRLILYSCLLGFIYFSLRALLSPVRLFAIQDYSLAAFLLGSFFVIGNIRLVKLHWISFLAVFILTLGTIAQYYEFNTHLFIDKRLDKSGISSFFAHRIFFGDFIACLAIINFGFFLSKNSFGVLLKLVCFASFLLCAIQVVASNSRGPFLVLIIGCSILYLSEVLKNLTNKNFVTSGKFKLSILLSFPLLLAILIVGVSKISDSRFGEEDKFLSDKSRIGYLKVALAIEANNKWLGSGANSYSYEAPKFVSRQSFKSLQNIAGLFAHNEYAQVYVDYGIIGAIVLFILIVFILGYATFHVIDVGISQVSWIKMLGLALLVALLVHASLNSIFHHLPSLFVLALALALTFKKSKAIDVSLVERIFLGILLLSLGLSLVEFAGKYSIVKIKQIDAYKKQGIERIGALHEIAESYPDHRNYYLLGRACHIEASKLTEYDQAKVFHDKAAQAYIKSLSYHSDNAEIYSELAKILAASKEKELFYNHINHAIRKFKTIDYHLGLSKYKSEMHYRMGVDDWERRKYDSALSNFKLCDEIADEAKERGVYNWQEWNFHKYCKDFLVFGNFYKSAKEAEEFFFGREPEKALGAYEASLKFYRQSIRLPLRGDERKKWQKLADSIKSRIDFLKNARIQGLEYKLPIEN